MSVMLYPYHRESKGSWANVMLRLSSRFMGCFAAILMGCVLAMPTAQAVEEKRVKGLPVNKGKICITGFDHNRPEPFEGIGDFIGWVGDVVRLANGELMFVHSAGYWHVSFATPRTLNADLIAPYQKSGLDMEHKAPDGRAHV